MMNRTIALALLALLLVACGSRPVATATGTTPLPASATTAVTTSADRQAVFTQIENDVRTRSLEVDEFNPASLGDQLGTGGQAQSGDDSRASLDLKPDGTIVRLGPNTLFTVEELKDDSQGPFTRLKLTLGQLWIILASGSLEIETPNGTGAVRGSYMSVAFDSQLGTIVTCLEGHCALSNRAGTTNLTDGQAATILDAITPPSPPRPLKDNELRDWLQNNPESRPFIPIESLETKTPGSLLGTLSPPDLNVKPMPGDESATRYTLINNCNETWHWKFIGPQVITFDIPAGQTATGSLPPGTYTALDWWKLDDVHHSSAMPPGGDLTVRGCPDQ